MSIGILANVNSAKTNRDVKPWISVCSRIRRLMNNQIKSSKRATLPKKRRERDDKSAVAIVKSVSQLGCASQDLGALVSQGMKFWGNSVQKVLEPVQGVRFTQSTSSKYPGKERTIVWKNTSQKSSSTKSLRCEI